MLGLYLHVPFCSSICNYCNFTRGLLDDGLKSRYVAALEAEIRRAPAVHALTGDDLDADTIFFGGGTPSLLDPDEIHRLIRACRETFVLPQSLEVTLETNPETSSRERMERFRAAGVNRISFGVQSFRDGELRRLGRVHSADRARAAVEEAREAGFGNVSLDLMMWLPQQSLEDWTESVEGLAAIRPEHASLYLLELYPNAPLKEEMARSGWSVAPDEDAAAMYLFAMERLGMAGYRQYEISNVARPGYESRHNLKYWTDGTWLGFGCGAHSTLNGVRWKNVAITEQYIRHVTACQSPVADRRVLTGEERLEEALFTGLRLSDGIDLDAVSSKYRVDVWARYHRQLEPFLAERLLVREGPRLRLSREGMLVANEIMAVFV